MSVHNCCKVSYKQTFTKNTFWRQLTAQSGGRGRHLKKKTGIVFILRIGWCRQRERERDRDRERSTLLRSVYNFLSLFGWWVPPLSSSSLRTWANSNQTNKTYIVLVHSGDVTFTDLIEKACDGLFTPSKSDIKCKIRLYLQIPGIIWLIFYVSKKVI